MKRFVQIGFLLITCTILFTQCDNDKNEAEDNFGGYATQLEYGHHLVQVGGCGDCHTPKKMTDMGPMDDSSRLFGGHPADMPIPPVNRMEMQEKGVFASQTLTAWVGPWGVSFAANLSPDSSGIGAWSEEQFFNALRKGWYKGLEGTRTLLPPMPVPSTMHYSDKELKAIFAYLKSIKPVSNLVPAAMPPEGMQ